MCGIFGIYSSKELSENDVSLVHTSKKYLDHRGPDEFNIKKINKNLIFSHSRLSIIDLSNKNFQPRNDNEFVISFNGEIYNFKDLKKKYLRSENFLTDGDTEVLLKMWKKFGKNCINYLDGMYAFAIWDGKILSLVTDRFSEKPLFYYQDHDKIIFSSEQKIFYECITNSSSLNETKFFDFMGVQINEESFCKNIKKMKPGCVLEISEGKIISEDFIYKKNLKENNISDELTNQNIEEILDLLLKSIKKRLISDQKISILQSGGYDSTLLLAIIKNEIKKDFQCYHLEQQNFSEKHQIISNFNKLKIPLNFIKFVQFDEKYLSIDNIINYHYQLTDNFSISLLDCICNEIKKDKIRVALSGTGGDELFYGYSKYYNAYKIDKKYHFLNTKLFKKISNYFPNNSTFKIFVNKNPEIISFLKNNFNFNYYIKYHKKIYFDKIFKLSEVELFKNMRNFDLEFTLPENLNFNQDIASMKNSVEIRSPYLNNDLFNYVENIDSKFFFEKGPKTLSKIILERYFKLNISKTGFTYSDNLKKKFISSNIKSIQKYNLENIFKINFQLGFKNFYKKKLTDKIISF